MNSIRNSIGPRVKELKGELGVYTAKRKALTEAIKVAVVDYKSTGNADILCEILELLIDNVVLDE